MRLIAINHLTALVIIGYIVLFSAYGRESPLPTPMWHI